MRTLTLWACLALISWTLGFGVNRSGLDTDLAWTLTLDSAKSVIASSLSGSRILFVGGSHTHYSVSASQLEEALGCPTVNLGLHAGLGLNPILARAEAQWRPGDLVVVFPEYGLLSGDGAGWLSSAYGAAIGDPRIGGFGAEQSARSILRAGTTSLATFGKSVVVAISGATGRAEIAIGARGDTEIFLSDLTPTGLTALPTRFNQHARARIATFAEEARNDGVRLIFALPWLYGDTLHIADMRHQARGFAQQLEVYAPVITHGAGHNLHTQRDLFSDTPFHASPEGRRGHTQALADGLRPLLPETCRQP